MWLLGIAVVLGTTAGGAMDGAAAGALTRPPVTTAPVAPLPAGARAAAADTVLVARRDLARGVALTAADMDTLVTSGERRTPGGERDVPRPTVGWITRRTLRAGEPLRPPAVAPPPLVAAGAVVTLVWDTGDLRLTRQGTAMAAAHAGERVTVRVDAKRRFTGVATAPGVVTMAAP